MQFLFFITFAITSVFSTHKTDSLPEKIVGGRDVEIKDYKYQVAILKFREYWCGGSILTKHNVLTASYCVLLSYGTLNVRAGSSFWSKGGSLHIVDRNHNNLGPNMSIAVLRIKEPFVFDYTRQPIPLATVKTVFMPGAPAILSGWGTDEYYHLPTQLQAVNVPLIDKNVCKAVYNGSKSHRVTEDQLCAGSVGRYYCKGDTGSPLVLNGEQIGVVHDDKDCSVPGIYSDVSYYHDWILKKIKH